MSACLHRRRLFPLTDPPFPSGIQLHHPRCFPPAPIPGTRRSLRRPLPPCPPHIANSWTVVRKFNGYLSSPPTLPLRPAVAPPHLLHHPPSSSSSSQFRFKPAPAASPLPPSSQRRSQATLARTQHLSLLHFPAAALAQQTPPLRTGSVTLSAPVPPGALLAVHVPIKLPGSLSCPAPLAPPIALQLEPSNCGGPTPPLTPHLARTPKTCLPSAPSPASRCIPLPSQSPCRHPTFHPSNLPPYPTHGTLVFGRSLS